MLALPLASSPVALTALALTLLDEIAQSEPLANNRWSFFVNNKFKSCFYARTVIGATHSVELDSSQLARSLPSAVFPDQLRVLAHEFTGAA